MTTTKPTAMLTTDAPVIITTPPERRQVARVLTFPATGALGNLTLYIDWDSIASTARQLGAHFEARTAPNGDVTITLFWAYGDED